MQSFGSDFRAVVIGAGGGLGGALVTALEAETACRETVGLGRASAPPLDLLDETSIARCADALARGGEVDLVIDATGVLHDPAHRMRPEKSLQAVDPRTMARAFAVNATGPLLLLKHFGPLLPRRRRGVFASLSARVGSIADNRLGGWYGYRASKAALNMVIRTAAIEIARKRPDSVCLALHPGTVATPLSLPFLSGHEAGEPDRAALRLLGVIDRAEPGQSGAFLAYDGSEIPW